jgi:hypothetical protein
VRSIGADHALDDRVGELGIEVNPPLRDLVDRAHQVVDNRALQNIAARARSQELAQIAADLVKRQRNDPRLGRIAPDQAGSVGAPHPRHGQVHHDHVGRELDCSMPGRFAVRCFTNDLQIGLSIEQRLETLAHNRVVVGQQDS